MYQTLYYRVLTYTVHTLSIVPASAELTNYFPTWAVR